MTKAVLHFEDIEKVTEEFKDLLKRKGLVFDDNLLWMPFSYLTPDNPDSTSTIRPESEVAKDAFKWIEENNPEYFACIADFRPESGHSPKYSQYGFEVLKEFAFAHGEKQFSPPFFSNFEDMISHKNILVIFLTVYPDEVISCIENAGHSISIISPKDDDGKSVTIPQALSYIKDYPKRIVCADRSGNPGWVSELVAKWILQI